MKVYIVIAEQWDYDEHACWNAGVFSTYHNAKEYVIGTKECDVVTPDGEYINSDAIRQCCDTPLEELIKKVREYSNIYPARSDEYAKFWENVYTDSDYASYKIEEHKVDSIEVGY